MWSNDVKIHRATLFSLQLREKSWHKLKLPEALNSLT